MRKSYVALKSQIRLIIPTKSCKWQKQTLGDSSCEVIESTDVFWAPEEKELEVNQASRSSYYVRKDEGWRGMLKKKKHIHTDTIT